MFPDEQTAMAWNTLTELKAFLSVSDGVLLALENKFGSFNALITNVSTLPEEVWRDGVRTAEFIVTAAVPANPQAQPPVLAQPAVVRPFLPVETGQAGMIWRVASRIFWTRAGRAWGDYMDFDVMLPPGQRTVAFAHPAVQQGAAPPPPAAGIPGSKIKQNQMTGQNDDSEFLAPTRAEEELYSQNYYQQKSNEPQEEEEPR